MFSDDYLNQKQQIRLVMYAVFGVLVVTLVWFCPTAVLLSSGKAVAMRGFSVSETVLISQKST